VRIEGELESTAQGLYDRMTGIGAHEVVIETPEPTEPLEALPTAHVVDILNGYRARMLDLNNDQRFRLIYVFRNVGGLSGASLRHAHSQIIALPVIPSAIEAKLKRAKAYYEAKERSLFSDILQAERRAETRVVAENDAFVLFCPYASRFPFELAVYPKRSGPNFTDCTASETQLLAEMLRTALTRLNQVLEKPSYNLLLHTAPLVRPGPEGIARYASTRVDYSWHLEILPRLSFLAGFELGLGSYINTVFPEDAARFLRGEEIR
jgi:UDPglucose--hexose-1-phosphate uridylyltransferase